MHQHKNSTKMEGNLCYLPYPWKLRKNLHPLDLLEIFRF
nr:MAG TPA: hypothetical protein [Caudoviricetes sp.]